MKQSQLKALIKECYKEVLAENEEMDLPDTRKVYMGDEPSKIDLGVDKRMSSNIDKVKKQIENLTNELKPLIASFNVAQKELQSKLASKQITKDEYDMQRSLIAKKYDEATRVLVSDLKKAKLADDRMIGMLNKL
jgi:RNase H-fold protein (predicted Holliday junction resolvase)